MVANRVRMRCAHVGLPVCESRSVRRRLVENLEVTRWLRVSSLGQLPPLDGRISVTRLTVRTEMMRLVVRDGKVEQACRRMTRSANFEPTNDAFSEQLINDLTLQTGPLDGPGYK